MLIITVEYLIILGLLCLPVTFLYLDINIFKDDVYEVSVTEISQTVLLLMSSVLFLIIAKRRVDLRGFCILATGFFLSMAVREQNNFLNDWHKYTWEMIVFVILVITFWQAYKNKTTIVQPLFQFLKSREGAVMVVSMALLHVLSRMLEPEKLWRQVMESGYVRVVKNMVEEGTETTAYIIGFYAVFLYFLHVGRARVSVS